MNWPKAVVLCVQAIGLAATMWAFAWCTVANCAHPGANC